MGRTKRTTFITIFLIIHFWVSSSSSETLSIYEVLRSHGLPMGLLPKGVKNFSLDDSGRFEVHLDQECNAKFENEMHYDRNVSGLLSFGRIADLSGISAQDLFLWFPVKGIRVDIPSSGLIYFDVGVVYKQFSLSLFETPRDCVPSPPDDQFHHLEDEEEEEEEGLFVKKIWGMVIKFLPENKMMKH